MVCVFVHACITVTEHVGVLCQWCVCVHACIYQTVTEHVGVLSQ